MAVTVAAAPRYERMAARIVPHDTPGISFISQPGRPGEPYPIGTHSHIRYENVRVPRDSILGPRGGGFKVAQSRLGGGRIHHAMRVIGMCRKAIDMMGERAHSRVTQIGRASCRERVLQYG